MRKLFNNWKIKHVALLFLISTGIVLSLLATVANFFLQQHWLYNHYDQNLHQAAMLAKSMLPADYHDSISGRDSISPEEFDQTVSEFNFLCQTLELEYLWSLMLVNDHPVFTSATSPDKKTENQLHAKFFELHSSPELYQHVFRTMQPHYQIIRDKWGTIRVALIPFEDAHGRKYLFGASKSISEIKLLSANFLTSALLISGVFFLAGTLIIISIYQRLTRPISQLVEAADLITSGEYDHVLDIQGPQEINRLTATFNCMRQAIQQNHTEQSKAHERDIQYQDRLKALGQELAATEYRERRYFADALHENLGQMLVGLNLKLAALKETTDRDRIDMLVPQVEDLLQQLIQTCKSLTWQVSPPALYKSDIKAGLEHMARELKEFLDLDVHISHLDHRIELSSDVSALLFSSAKELLVNIAEHAGSSVAGIELYLRPDRIQLVVSDQGIGFDNSSPSEGLGLFKIQERLSYANGSLKIKSLAGLGSRITIEIPLDYLATE